MVRSSLADRYGCLFRNRFHSWWKARILGDLSRKDQRETAWNIIIEDLRNWEQTTKNHLKSWKISRKLLKLISRSMPMSMAIPTTESKLWRTLLQNLQSKMGKWSPVWRMSVFLGQAVRLPYGFLSRSLLTLLSVRWKHWTLWLFFQLYGSLFLCQSFR